MARKMKDSGIEWIGEIPEGWEIKRLGAILQERNEVNNPIQTTSILSLTNNRGVIPYSEKGNQGNKAKDDLTGYKIAHNYNYLFQTTAFQQSLRGYGNGILEIRMRIQMQKLKTVLLPVPTFLEQSNITVYLDASLSKLNILLSKIRSSIEEYKKLKQAVITQAVTKGVRGEREMKDSGNPWFGQIPTDWKLSRVGLHFSIILGKMLCNAPLNDTYTLEPYYCAADVHFDGVADGERKKMWFSPIEKDLYRVSVGDLLVVEGGAGAGGSAIVENQDSDTYIQNSIMIVRSKGNSDNRYLRYLLEFLVKQGYIDIVCNKATIPHFTKDKLSCIPFCLCPTGEQEEIADYLDTKCAEIDGLIAKKEQLVKELESYKKSLIYEVVTGKREV